MAAQSLWAEGDVLNVTNMNTKGPGGMLASLSITAGELLYGSAANTLATLDVGTNGHVLTLSGGLPTWAAVSASGVDHGGLSGLADNDHPQYLLVADIDDTPVNGEVAQPISSNWAFDHVAAADPHTGYRLESADHTHQSTGLQGGQLDHGLALTGLTDDDHTQYLLAAGTRALSADWDAGSFEIRAQTFESDVTTGTAPLVIASTTVVTNLNADLLDGSHASVFALGATTLTAGVGLSGGGDLSANRTFTVDLNELTTETTIEAGDFIAMVDITDSGSGKITLANLQGTIDHGSIAGLADDDHTQYLLANGTRALSADWDAGSFEVRAQTFESDVATGTAPMVIASTTLVTNLNADLLDGEHASAFADASHTHAASDITAGTFTAGTYSFAGSTQTDGGIITTVDINGGTADGVTIGGASAAAATVTTLTAGTSVLGTTANGYLDLYGDSGATVGVRLTDAGLLVLGVPATNANMTVGITIDGGAADDQYLTLRSSDVETALTTAPSGPDVDTNVFATFAKTNATAGGLRITALGESTGSSVNFQYESIGGAANTTKTTSGRGLCEYQIAQHDGAGALADIAADGNVYAIRARVGGSFRTMFLVDEDGDFHYDGADGGAFDGYEDDKLLRAFQRITSDPDSIVLTPEDNDVAYDRKTLEDAKLIGVATNEDETPLISGKHLLKAVVGRSWQSSIREQRLKQVMMNLLNDNPGLQGRQRALDALAAIDSR